MASSATNSINGLLMRSIEEATTWQVIAIRMSALSVALLLVYCLQERGRLRSARLRFGPVDLLGAMMIATAHPALLWSMSQTTIANTMFILSSAPFLTALLAWVFLRERIDTGLWVAMGVALAGITLMLADGLGAGSLAGNALALLAALNFAGFVIVLRRGRSRNMLPMVILGAALGAAVSGAMAGFDLAVPAADLAIALAWGGVLSCLVHVLFVLASRHVQGAELTLVVLLEFILAPVWVWLVFAETPSRLTLLGGSLVLLALASRGVRALWPGGRGRTRR